MSPGSLEEMYPPRNRVVGAVVAASAGAAAGAGASAVGAAASAVYIYYVDIGGRKTLSYKYEVKYIQQRL